MTALVLIVLAVAAIAASKHLEDRRARATVTARRRRR